MKKYNLSLLFAVATLMLGACQSLVKVEEVVNDGVEAKVEQDSPAEVEVEESKIKTTTLDKDTIREMKERYGFSDEGMASNNEVIAEEDSKDLSSVEKVNGKLDSEEVKTTNDNETSSTVSTSTPNTNATSTKPNTSDSTTNNNSSNVTKPNNNPSSSNSSTTNKPTTPPVVEKPSEPAPQPTPPVVEQPSEPTPPVVEETKKPVDILDWNHIKSTLIAKGESLGMTYEPSMNRELDGWESPYQSSYMTVSNDTVIGYLGHTLELCASGGWTHFNIEWAPQGDGNVNIYIIR